MNIILGILFTFLLAHHGFSQTDMGRFIYGVDLGFSNKFETEDGPYSYQPATSRNSVEFSLSPMFGGFVTKNFAVLAKSNVCYSFGYDLTEWKVGIGPEFRYYVGKGTVKFFVFTNIIPSYSQSRYLDYSKYETYANNRNFILGTSTGPGMALFNEKGNFGFHLNLAFNTLSSFINHTQFAFGLNVAFNGLFSIKSKTK